jgi:DNA repair protein RecN (Recombination protein N)
MLLELHIKNFAIIDKLSLVLKPGFNVFTGETGAGKSILIDALNQILGERADSAVIRTGSETCTVDALLDIQDISSIPPILDEAGITFDNKDELLIKRELSRSGKNRCWVNGQLTTLSTLQKLGDELADLHGQHDHQSLLRNRQQMDFLDNFAGNNLLREQVYTGWQQLTGLMEKLSQAKESEAQMKARIEDLQYIIKEVDGAALQPGEEETLKSKRELLRNSEKLFQLINGLSGEILGSESSEQSGIISSIDRCQNMLRELAQLSPQWKNQEELLEQANIAISQLAREISDYQSKMNMDPEQLEQIEERLDILHRLKRKYRTETVEALIDMYDQWKKELDNLCHSEERISELEKAIKEASAGLGKIVSSLSESRSKASGKLAKLLQKELTELGMPHAAFQIKVSPKENGNPWFLYQGKNYHLTQTGWDDVEFLFSANPGEPAKSLSKIASGGELSRVMLALKATFAKADSVPTLIFDEIDAGIGGQTAHAVAQKLQQISKDRQVLVITHLPAIAAKAEAHFLVNKQQDAQNTTTQITELSKSERKIEISRMLGGDGTDKASLKYAEELLQ